MTVETNTEAKEDMSNHGVMACNLFLPFLVFLYECKSRRLQVLHLQHFCCSALFFFFLSLVVMPERRVAKFKKKNNRPHEHVKDLLFMRSFFLHVRIEGVLGSARSIHPRPEHTNVSSGRTEKKVRAPVGCPCLSVSLYKKKKRRSSYVAPAELLIYLARISDSG